LGKNGIDTFDPPLKNGKKIIDKTIYGVLHDPMPTEFWRYFMHAECF